MVIEGDLRGDKTTLLLELLCVSPVIGGMLFDGNEGVEEPDVLVFVRLSEVSQSLHPLQLLIQLHSKEVYSLAQCF